MAAHSRTAGAAESNSVPLNLNDRAVVIFIWSNYGLE